MGIKLWSTVGTLALAFALTGCDKTPEPTAVPSPAPAPAAAATAPAPMMAPEVPPAPATMPTQAVPSITTPETKPMAAATPAATQVAAAPVTPTAMQQAETTATTLLQQGVEYVKNNKLDLAQSALTKLQGMKSSLPASFGPKIDEYKTMVDAAQAANGKLPGGIKIPGM